MKWWVVACKDLTGWYLPTTAAAVVKNLKTSQSSEYITLCASKYAQIRLHGVISMIGKNFLSLYFSLSLSVSSSVNSPTPTGHSRTQDTFIGNMCIVWKAISDWGQAIGIPSLLFYFLLCVGEVLLYRPAGGEPGGADKIALTTKVRIPNSTAYPFPQHQAGGSGQTDRSIAYTPNTPVSVSSRCLVFGRVPARHTCPSLLLDDNDLLPRYGGGESTASFLWTFAVKADRLRIQTLISMCRRTRYAVMEVYVVFFSSSQRDLSYDM